jgi:hypothetical protein
MGERAMSWRRIGIVVAVVLMAAGMGAAAAATPEQKAELDQLKTSIGWVDYVLGRAKQGDLLVNHITGDGGALIYPVNRDYVVWRIRRDVMKGKTTAQRGAATLLALGQETGMLRRGLEAERADLLKQKAALERAMNQPRPALKPWEMGRAPAPPPKPAAEEESSFVGAWHWSCCQGGYSGTFRIDSDHGGAIEGKFVGGTGGKIKGHADSDGMEFDRTDITGDCPPDHTQHWSGKTQDDGSIKGHFKGCGDSTVSWRNEFKLEKD